MCVYVDDIMCVGVLFQSGLHSDFVIKFRSGKIHCEDTEVYIVVYMFLLLYKDEYQGVLSQSETETNTSI